MIKSYRSIWNEALGAWVAAPETARARGKSSRVRVVSTLAAVVMLGSSAAALAADCSSTVNGQQTGTCLIPANGTMTITSTGSVSDGYIGFNDGGGAVTLTIQAGGSYNSTDPYIYSGRSIRSWMPVFASTATLNNAGSIIHSGTDRINGFEDAYTNGGNYTVNNSGLFEDISNNPTGPLVLIIGNNNKFAVNNSGTMQSNKSSVFTVSNGSGNAGTIVNNGLMQSNGAAVITGSGNNSVNIVNAGTIATGVSNGAAITLGTANDSLTLDSTSVITGYVDAGAGTDTLALAGSTDGSFDISQIGATQQYRNFEVLQKNDAATWTLTGDNSATQVQNWQLNQGALIVAGQLTGSVTQTNSSGTVDLQVDGGSITADPADATHTAIAMTGSGDATVELDTTAGAVNIDGAIVASADGNKTLTLSGSQDGTLEQQVVGAAGFDHYVKSGSGNWTLSGASGGASDWDLQAGTLTVDNNLSLGSGQLTLDGGSLLMQNGLTLANAVDVAVDSSLNVEDGNQDTLAGTLSGAGSLNKTGTGTLVLSGDSSGFGGASSVSAGTVVVDGALGGSRLTVGAGATLSLLDGTLDSASTVINGSLQGNGTINGSVSVASGGTLAPGSRGVLGAMTVNGDLNMAAGANLDYDIGVPGTPGMPGQSDALQVNGNVSLNGNLNIASDGSGGVGYYTVLDYSGTLSGTLSVNEVPVGYTAGAFQIDNTQPGHVDLVVGGSDPSMHYWNGATTTADDTVHGGNGVWNASNTNWTNQNGSISAVSANSGNMIFSGQAGTVDVEGDHQFDSLQFVSDGYVLDGSGTLTLQTGSDNEVRVLDGNSTTIQTSITGAGALDKTEGGTLILSGNNSYSGGTTFNGGTVVVSSDGNLGAASGDLSFAGGALETSASMSTARDVHFQQGGGALNVDTGTTLSMSGTLDGTGGMVKQGAGTLLLTGDNSYAGGSLLEAGVTEISASDNLGSGALVLDGGVLHSTADIDLGNSVALADQAGRGAFDVDGSTTLTLDGAVDGAGALVKQGDGTLVLSGDNSYGGGTVLDDGTIRLASDTAAGSGSIDVAGAGSTLDFAAGVKVGNAISLNADLNANVDAADAQAIEYGQISGSGSLSKTGAGTLLLLGDNSYSGDTNLDAGVLQVGGLHALGSGSINGNGGTLSYLDGAQVDNALQLNQDTTLDVGDADALATQAGAISGSGSLNKSGAGTLVLSGDNDYSGATTIGAGTLQIDGSAADSDFVVANGATLSGSGTVGALDAHGVVSPGVDGGIGQLSVANNLTLESDASYDVSVGADGTSDHIQVGGTADIQGATLNVTAQSGEYQQNTRYDIVSATGGVSGQFGATDVNLPFLTPSVGYDANNAYLSLTRNDVPFFDFGATPNQRHVGDGLEEMQDKVGGNALLDAVSDLTAPDIPHAYEQLSAESYASLQNAAQNNTDTFMSSVWAQLGSPQTESESGVGAKTNGNNLWVSLPFAQQHVDSTGTTTGYDSQTWGFNMGADTEVAPNTRVGVAGGYLSTEQKDSSLGSDGTVNTGNLSVYGQYDNGNWWLGGLAGLGVGRLSNHRSVSFPGYSATADGSAPVQSAFAKVGGGYRIKTAVGTIEPLASVDMSSTRIGNLTESGSSDMNLNVQGSTQTSVASEVGARFSRAFTTDAGKSGAFSASLSWRHQLVTPDSTVNAGFVTGNTSLLSYQGWQPQKDSAVVGLGVKVSVSKSADLSFGYQGQFGGGQTSNALVGQFQYHW